VGNGEWGAMSKMISVVLIDDHPLAINGIGSWLKGTGRFTVSGTAKNLAESVALMEELDSLPEIIILDISLGRENGLDFIPMLKKICGKRKAAIPGILVCSVYEDPFMVQRAMNLGASGYVPKSEEPGEIIEAIDAILKGETFISPRCQEKEEQQQKHFDLTSRENEIIVMIKQSFSAPQIAERLGLSIRTVEKHLEHIYLKTGVSSWEELYKL
jgi:DNA-binding NarL/FixJ family response regulator